MLLPNPEQLAENHPDPVLNGIFIMILDGG